jgi:hydrogenase expression/formation protein HypC
MCLGIPAQIVAITDPVHQLATVSVAGVERSVSVACIVSDALPLAACVGEWVLVHAGFALSRIDAREAAATLALLASLDELPGELPDTPADASEGQGRA